MARSDTALAALGGRGIDDRLNLRDAVGADAALLGVPADHRLIGRDIDAIHLVARDVTVHPLYLGAELVQHGARRLRRLPPLLGRETPRARDVPFDDEFRHGPPLV